MDLLAELAARRVVAIVRATAANHLVDVVATLAGSGVALIELPLTTPGALAAIRECATMHAVLMGAGTVLTADEANDAIAAGARYLVTPAVLPDVLDAAAVHGVPVLCGAFTATEALAAMRGGAAAVKIFPACVGGPAYIAALKAPLSRVPFLAVGGVSIQDAPGYLAAGALAVGIGSPLVGDAAEGGSLDDLADRAHSLVEAVA